LAFHLGTQPFLDDPSFRQMIERYDMYLAVAEDGLPLLQQLALKRVFLPPLPESAAAIDPSEYEPGSHRMSGIVRHQSFRKEFDDPDLYRLFYRNLQRFRSQHEKTQQVRRLHQSIEKTPGHDDLVTTLQNYYYWLQSLQSYERAGLTQQKSMEGKVSAITELKTRLDNRHLDDAMQMPSEVIRFEESQRLAETLAELPPWQQNRLLNNDPIQIINVLQQSTSR
jgi:hypothetical protein